MDRLKRGDVILVVVKGDYGKPRPAVIVQSDILIEHSHTLVVCPMTSTLVDLPILRIRVNPEEENGLQKPSDIMLDKIIALKRSRIRGVIGRLDEAIMDRLMRALSIFLGIV